MIASTRTLARLCSASLGLAGLISAQTLTPSTTQLAFDGVAAGSAAQTRQLSVAVTGGTGLTLTASASTSSGGNWLAVTPATTPSPSGSVAYTVTATPGSLTAGTYTGQLSFAMPTALTATVPVTMTITAGAASGLTLNPASLSLPATVGSAPIIRTVAVTGPQGSPPLNFTAAANAAGNWLSVSPASGSTPAQLQITATPGPLVAGTYNGIVTVTPTGGTALTLNVTMTLGGAQPATSITAAPANLTFTVAPNSGPSPIQTVALTGSSAQLISVNVTSATATGGNWLTVAPSTGSLPLSLSVSVNPLSLAAGSYTGSVSAAVIGSSEPPLVIPVTLTVQGGAQLPALQANPDKITFTVGPTDPRAQSQSIALSAAGGAALAVTASASGGAWITVNPVSATTPATISASINASGLPDGTYTASIAINSPGASAALTIPVTLVVGSGGTGGGSSTFDAFPSAMNFEVQSGRPLPAAQFITATGSGAFTASVATTAGGNWLEIAPASGSLPGVVLVRLSGSVASALPVGGYNGTVTISPQAAGSTPRTVAVRLNVGNNPALTSSVQPLLYTVAANGAAPNPATFTVNSSAPAGSPALPVQVTAAAQSGGAGWLTATASGSSTPAAITVAVNPAGLAAGRYDGTVTVSSSQQGVASFVLPVRLQILSGTLLTTSTNQVTFASTGGVTPSPTTISLAGLTGTATYTAAATVVSPSGGTWLTVQPTTGSVPGNLTVSASPQGLATGEYAGSVVITAAGAANSPVVIPVLFSVTSTTPAGITAAPASLTFAHAPGAAAPPAQSVQLSAASSTSFTAAVATSSGGAWLAVSPTSGQLPGTLSVSLSNTSTMAAGAYNGSVTVTTSSGSVTIPVTLTIGAVADPVLAASPVSLAFTGPAGGAAPGAQTVQLTTPGATVPRPFTASVATQSGGNWLSITPVAGAAPASIQASVNTAGLAAGVYNGSIAVTPQNAAVLTIPVTLTITAAGGGGGTGTGPAVTGVVNAATQMAGSISPGLVVFIRGTGLGPVVQARPVLDAQGRVPTTLANTRVTFGGIPAPLIAVQQDAISTVVPFGIGGRASVPLVVESNGVSSPPTTLTVADTAPGVFSIGGTGSGQGAILNQDLTVNSTQNPAARGSIAVLYMTGDGALTPEGADGEVTGPSLLRKPVRALQLRVGGVLVPASDILYAGSAPGIVLGVTQVNFVVPNSVTAGGAVPVEVSVGGTAGAASVTMAVR